MTPGSWLPALAATQAIPDAWRERFGDLDRVGAHAAVQVLRTREGTRFVKVHDEPRVGQREAAVLGSALPVAVPALLESAETEAGQVVLVLAGARRPGFPRVRRLSVDALAQCARLLAKVHTSPIAAGLAADEWIAWWRRRARALELPAELRARLAEVTPIADAFCHHNLHPSNWLLDESGPIGLLDWAVAGRGDPESDLAGLAHAAGGDPAGVEVIAAAWERGASRPADRARIHLHLWLLLAEGAAAGKPEPHADEVARIALAGAPHGRRQLDRLVEKSEVPHRPRTSAWSAIAAPDAIPLLDRLGLQGVVIETGAELSTYSRHACNDVLALSAPRCVLKLFNKPIWGPLFELESFLENRLRETHTTVLAPLRLATGGFVFRIDDHVGAVYPWGGEASVGTTNADVERVARSLADLHSIPDVAATFPELPSHRPRVMSDDVLDVCGQVAPEALVSVRSLVAEAVGFSNESLPVALVHGSIHRDHLLALPDGRLAILDLEKARIAPRILDVLTAALYFGYRGNDEKFDPNKVVRFIVAWHRAAGMTEDERASVFPLLMEALMKEWVTISREVGNEAAKAHARVLLSVAANRTNLEWAIAKYTASQGR